MGGIVCAGVFSNILCILYIIYVIVFYYEYMWCLLNCEEPGIWATSGDIVSSWRRDDMSLRVAHKLGYRKAEKQFSNSPES